MDLQVKIIFQAVSNIKRCYEKSYCIFLAYGFFITYLYINMVLNPNQRQPNIYLWLILLIIPPMKIAFGSFSTIWLVITVAVSSLISGIQNIAASVPKKELFLP